MLKFSTKVPAEFVADVLLSSFLFGGLVVCLGLFVFWRARKVIHKLDLSGTKPTALQPDVPASSLPLRAVKGLAYRVEASRVGRGLSNAKKTARRSLEGFAARAELDREIAKKVRGQYPSDKSD